MDNIIFCNKIYSDLKHLLDNMQEEEFKNPSLFQDGWGAALYLYYYEKYFGKELCADFYLMKLYDNLDAKSLNYTYCTGLSGPFWLLHHLNKHQFIEIDIPELMVGFIENAIIKSKTFIDNKNFDLLHGSAGICALLVNFVEYKNVRQHLIYFVNALCDISVTTEKGISFPTFHFYEDSFSDVGIDAISLAHGTCSYQLLLLKFYLSGIEKDKCKELIYNSLKFILSNERILKDQTDSLYSSYLDGKDLNSSVSWCYGDLSLAFSLWLCGKEFENEYWKNKAISIFKHNTNRDTCEKARIYDVCICHGTAGNAAMYFRIWQETKEPIFLECAEKWYALTYEMLEFSKEEDIHGIKVWKGDEDGWQYKWDLLDGSAGVGLALLTHAVGEALPWDEFLFIS